MITLLHLEIKNMLKYIEESYKEDWCSSLLKRTAGASQSWSESSLYWTYLTMNNKVYGLLSGPSLVSSECLVKNQPKTFGAYIYKFTNIEKNIGLGRICYDDKLFFL